MNRSLHLTTLVPESPLQPVEMRDDSAAVRMAVVERSGVRTLGEQWDRSGVYLLLDPPHLDGTWGCYVGKAPAGVATRLRSHVTSKDHWSRALLVLRDTSNGFNSAHAAWLEGRLYEVLGELDRVSLHNRNQPGDDTLPYYERFALESCASSVLMALRVLGYDTAPPSTGGEKVRSPIQHGIALAELVESGLLCVGSQLVSTNSKHPAEGQVGSGGGVLYEGVEYASPSSAAMAAKRGIKANGWEFWAVVQPGGARVPLAVYREQYQASGG